MSDFKIFFKIEMNYLGLQAHELGWDFEDPITVVIKETELASEKYVFQTNKIEHTSDVNYSITAFFSLLTNDNRFKAFEEFFKKSESICIQNSNLLLTVFFIAEKKFETLIDRTRKSFKKFRWRFQLNLHKNTSTKFNFAYSINEQQWFPIVDCPAPLGLRATAFSVPEDHKLIHRKTESFFESSVDEPIYVDMMREAKLILNPNYKSSFAIAVAALETATKAFISGKIAQAKTLIEVLPSPSLYVIFNQILPEIEPRLKLKEEHEKRIKTIMVKRNDLMHKGAMNEDHVKTSEYVILIDDLILLLNYFLGFTWLDIQHARRLLADENFN